MHLCVFRFFFFFSRRRFLGGRSSFFHDFRNGLGRFFSGGFHRFFYFLGNFFGGFFRFFHDFRGGFGYFFSGRFNGCCRLFCCCLYGFNDFFRSGRFFFNRRSGLGFYFGHTIHGDGVLAFIFSRLLAAGSDPGFFLLNPFGELLVGLFLGEGAFFHPAGEVFAQQYAFKTKNGAHRIGGLGAVHEPLECAVAVQFDGSGNSEGIVGTDFLDKAAVARGAVIGDYDVVKRCGFTTFTLQTEFDWHCE